MSDNTIFYLTKEKQTELEAELIDLQKQIMPAIAKRIDEAKQNGDLSENAEYHAAREEMVWARSRESEIKTILNDTQIISEEHAVDGKVRIGSTLTVEVNGKHRDYTIVGAQEADPLSGKISNESPLGQALLGAKKNTQVEVDVPAGKQVYTIISVK